VSLRVAQLVTELDPGGAERIVHDIATGLDPSRFESLVISVRPATGDVAEWLERAGVPVRSLGSRGRLGLGDARRLARVLKEERVEVLHAHLHRAIRLAASAAPRAGVRATVATVHDIQAMLAGWRLRAMRRAARGLDAVACVSEAARADFVARVGIAPEKVRVIPNGVDAERFDGTLDGAFDRAAVRRGLGVDDDAFLIISLGRLRPEKGHDTALRAMVEVVKDEPKARLVVVGDGPERARLEKLASSLGLEPRTTFAGQRDDVPAVLAAADCMVAPSRFEGFGLAAAEAMAAGLAVVASNVHALPELIEDGVSGLLVPPDDAAELARAVLGVLRDREIAKRLGEGARARVAERFGLGAMLRAYAALYTETLEAKGAPL
jgi:glycosyltransferase involved in cell wall biosynthesis